jgi:transposase
MDNMLPAVGIDVSKLTLDVRVEAQDRPRRAAHRVANHGEGFTQLQSWFHAHGLPRVHACLEATGTYSDAIARFLFEQGHHVSVVNPARVAAFRTSEGIRTKTDRHDALVLARFCAQKRPALWCPTPGEVQQMQVLLGRHDELLAARQQERNRLENHRLDPFTRQSIQEHSDWLQKEAERTLHRAEALLLAHDDLRQACARLDSIPGIAPLTAMRLYSVFFDQQRFDRASKLVAHAGLCSARQDSGTSVHRKASISKHGNALVRKWLYMSALSVKRYDPDFRQWAAELQARGKSGMCIVVAIMRKLLHLVHGVLKANEDYDAHKAFPAHYRRPTPPQEEAA